MALAGLHIFLFRKAGPPVLSAARMRSSKQSQIISFHAQVWKDIVAMAAVFVTICGLAFIGTRRAS